jgi:hypothetical protein
MKNDLEKPDIDLVYLWVDGSDPAWLAKKNVFIGNSQENTSINCKGRYANNDELKYSLRSVEKYAPWIRQIFIVTDEQTPDWIDAANPKIKITDHMEIMPQECLPCFNPTLIEHFLHKIPGLSEHFLFSNDDTLINKPVSPDTFFADDGFPIIRLNRKPLREIRWFYREHIRRKPLMQYSRAIANASELLKKRYGVYYSGLPHHNIDAYLKSDCQRVAEDIFRNELETVFTNHIRNRNDFQRILYSYVALAEKRGHLRYVSKKESLLADIHKKRDYKNIEKYNPVLLCLNDSQYADDNDRAELKAWLDNCFPEKSSFEK